MKIRAIALTLSLILLSNSASAAIKVRLSQSALGIDRTLKSGDQISDFAVTQNTIGAVGTVDSVSPILSGTSAVTGLGGSDGFIIGINSDKTLAWQLRLGSALDDIATAVTSDRSGNFWIAGASTKLALGTPVIPVDPVVINIDNVLTESQTDSNKSLSHLTLWEVSPTGELLATYMYDSAGVVAPKEISFNGTAFKINGLLTQNQVTKQFEITVDQSGVFTELLTPKIKKIKTPEILTIKAGPNDLKSFISKTTIIGIPSWRAKSPTPVIVKYAKNRSALAANSFKGKVRKILWRSGIGAVVLVKLKSENELHILKNMG